MLDDVALGGAQAGDCARDEARVVRDCGAAIGYLHGAAVGNGLEEAQEGDFMGREAWVRGRGASDLGDVDGTAGESRDGEAPGQGPVAGESEEFRRGARHFLLLLLLFSFPFSFRLLIVDVLIEMRFLLLVLVEGGNKKIWGY